MFIFFFEDYFESSKFFSDPKFDIVFNISYRGMVTFSRGMITGFMIVVIVAILVF
jgi:hypothetical protein